MYEFIYIVGSVIPTKKTTKSEIKTKTKNPLGLYSVSQMVISFACYNDHMR